MGHQRCQKHEPSARSSTALGCRLGSLYLDSFPQDQPPVKPFTTCRAAQQGTSGQNQVPADCPDQSLQCDTPALHSLEQILSPTPGPHLPKVNPSQNMELCQPQQDVCCVLSPPSKTFMVCSCTAILHSQLWVCRKLGGQERLPKGPSFTQQSSGRGKRDTPLCSPLLVLFLDAGGL